MDFDSVLLENELAPLKNIYRLVLCLFSSGFTLVPVIVGSVNVGFQSPKSISVS